MRHPRRQKNSGFALVAALGVMAAIFIIAIAMNAYTQATIGQHGRMKAEAERDAAFRQAALMAARDLGRGQAGTANAKVRDRAYVVTAAAPHAELPDFASWSPIVREGDVFVSIAREGAQTTGATASYLVNPRTQRIKALQNATQP